MSDFPLDKFRQHLKWAEGVRFFPYKCSAGKWTIGIGRNLDDVGISEDEMQLMLGNDIQRTLVDCRRLDYWHELDPIRQLVVADMVFNLGVGRFIRFVNTNKALAKHDYGWAAAEMIDSQWYTQVGRRAEKLVKAMRTGEWDG